MILNDLSNFLFYFKTVDKRNERLWITIQYYDNCIWGISDTNLDSQHFINYKLKLVEETNRKIFNCDSD